MTVDLERGYKRRELCGPKQYLNLLLRSILMIYVGIDVAKDKHDCFMEDFSFISSGEPNTRYGSSETTSFGCTQARISVEIHTTSSSLFFYRFLFLLMQTDNYNSARQ